MFREPTAGPVVAMRAFALGAVLALGGCATFAPEAPPPPPPRAPQAAPEPPPVVAPVAMHRFPFDPKKTGVLGEVQVTQSRHEDTLADIARRFDVGYDELIRANPGVDPWLPGEGTRIILPTQWVLPDAPADGIVINVAAMRLFYFPKPKKGEQRVVITYPIGVGKVGWATPIGSTTVVSKRKDPMWTPPDSVRKEHAKKGDPLPARVPAGPDNPLGAYAMNLGWPSYLIHGTNKPPGVGMRASHGCIRLYPEDIAALFPMIAVGTKVTVVNQPLLYRWQGNNLYVQSYPPVVEGEDESVAPPPVVFDDRLANQMWQQTRAHAGAVNWDLVKRVVTQTKGISVPVTKRGLTLDSYLASARRVENELPQGSNWDGDDGSPGTATVKPVADSGARARR